jgi:predicted transcriptional regulator
LGSYRDRLDIMADILNVVGLKPKKTQIMYQANLSFCVLQKYLALMSDSSLICFEAESRCYVLTPKGKVFLETYQDYSKRNRRAKKIFSEVNSQKVILEKLFHQ